MFCFNYSLLYIVSESISVSHERSYRLDEIKVIYNLSDVVVMTELRGDSVSNNLYLTIPALKIRFNWENNNRATVYIT